MNLTKEEYQEIYFGLNVPDYELFLTDPTSDEDFLMNYASSKLWRLNNLYSVINKQGRLVKFVMNMAQHIVFAAHMAHPRVIILKSRQRGISTFYLIDYFDNAVFNDNTVIGMQSYGLEESAALLKRWDVAWDNFPEQLKEFMGLRVVKSNTKAIGFSNGSVVKIQTSFRGETLQGLHVSEVGKIASKNPQKAVELRAGTLQALAQGLPAALESTAEGMHNAFYDMWYDAVNVVGVRNLLAFKPIFLSWVDDPDCNLAVEQVVTTEDQLYISKVESDLEIQLEDTQKWWAVAKRIELGELFNQEYPYSAEAAFAAVRDGTYYARLWGDKGSTVDSGLYDINLVVHTSWDLGMNDTMEIGFWQVHLGKPRLVDYYYNSGEGLEHYVNMLRGRNYMYGTHVLPHDINVKELGMAKTRLGVLYDLGLRNTHVLPRTSSVTNDIEVVRGMIPHLTVDKAKCARVIRMFGMYTKEWDANKGVFKDKPLHNEWSNPADMVRYFAMSGMWKVKANGGMVGKENKKVRRERVPRGFAI